MPAPAARPRIGVSWSSSRTFRSDPLWADYRDLAKSHGLRACWSSPIFSKDLRVLGTFAMYFHECGAHVHRTFSSLSMRQGPRHLPFNMSGRVSLSQGPSKSETSFSSAASHELRTPLTPLKMQAQVLARLVAGSDPHGLVKSDDLRMLVEGVSRQVSQLLKMSEDLLNVARVGAGELTLKRQKCDLAAIVRASAARYREDSEKAHCPLHVHADSCCDWRMGSRTDRASGHHTC